MDNQVSDYKYKCGGCKFFGFMVTRRGNLRRRGYCELKMKHPKEASCLKCKQYEEWDDESQKRL